MGASFKVHKFYAMIDCSHMLQNAGSNYTHALLHIHQVYWNQSSNKNAWKTEYDEQGTHMIIKTA